MEFKVLLQVGMAEVTLWCVRRWSFQVVQPHTYLCIHINYDIIASVRHGGCVELEKVIVTWELEVYTSAFPGGTAPHFSATRGWNTYSLHTTQASAIFLCNLLCSTDISDWI